jgi:hypothetical protein
MPMLLAIDNAKDHDIIFSFDPEKQVWCVRFEIRAAEMDETGAAKKKRSRGGE